MDEPIAQFDTFCRTSGQPVFKTTPLHLHTCRIGCTFFHAGPRTSVCTSSRHVHECGEHCPFLQIEEHMVCTLTMRTLGPRLDYRYYDGTTTFTPRRRHAMLSTAMVNRLIVSTIEDMISGKGRVQAEEVKNRRLARQELVAITKSARSQRLHRGNWLHYFELFIANSTRVTRFIPHSFHIQMLAGLIQRFYGQVFPDAALIQRNLVSFTAVCLSELATGSKVFPLIPWVQKAIPVLSSHYRRLTLVTCRGMTATLALIVARANASMPPLTFPLV